jgi:uncharacterized lipoprotein YehR (DUF1307 family)
MKREGLMGKSGLRAVSALLAMVLVLSLAGCGKRVEAVITTDGEDVTEATKQYETLSASTAAKFSYDDLKVGKVTYLMKESQVVALLGQPSSTHVASETDKTAMDLKEKIYSYNDLTLVFTEIGGEYLLTAAAGVGDDEVFSRGLSVGDTFDDILKVYYREQNALNNYYFTDDKTTILGKFLYGSYTIDVLENVKIKSDIEYGLINYNGYNSIETAESYIVEFTCFKAPYKNGYATINDAFAQIDFDIDNSGKITSIRWYYYPEMD